MKLLENDFFWKTLVLEMPPGGESTMAGAGTTTGSAEGSDGGTAAEAASAEGRNLSAKVTIRQPQGYTQVVETSDIELDSGKARIGILYPLIDDGRFDPSHGTWNGAWEMGEYRFDTVLHRGGVEVCRDRLTLDPSNFYPSDHRYVIAVDAKNQFIECAPRQSLYSDEGEALFLIRIREHRVTRCSVEVDVTRHEQSERLAGPWKLRLSGGFQEKSFSIRGWKDGEYWIRIRFLDGGEPVGPFCVRKFWKQAAAEVSPPDIIELQGYPEVLVDDYSIGEARGVQFVPVPMESDHEPVVPQTEEYEEEGMRLQSLTWNGDQNRFEGVYQNFLRSGDKKADQEKRKHLKMLIVSSDGDEWRKPSLGIVGYHGSRANNIIADETDDSPQQEQEEKYDIEHARFRFYDPESDGPVDMENVFLASGKGYFPFACRSLPGREELDRLAKAEKGELKGARADGLGVMKAGEPVGEEVITDKDIFRPRGGEHWVFEKRGDLYLVLNREPVLYLGIGMDLLHTTESIRCHVEYTGRLGNAGGVRKRLFYYFRPGSPAYPPHGAPCDNMHMCLRCLAVMWTDDGFHFERRFVIGPDACDPVGMQFYSMGMFQKFGTFGDAPGRPVLNKCLSKQNLAFHRRNLYLGSTLLHRGIEQTQAPELIWTRDFMSFRRFTDHRRCLIENGKGGAFDAGQVREQYRYCEKDGCWWYSYTGVNTRHNGYGIMAGDFKNPADLAAQRWNQAEASYFSTWEGHFADGKATRYLPGLARCRSFRVACAEPVEVEGVIATRPVRVQQDVLVLNASTDPGGFIGVEIERISTRIEPGDRLKGDGTGKPAGKNEVIEYRFEGDETEAQAADLSEWRDRVIIIRFTLHRARLYAFCV